MQSPIDFSLVILCYRSGKEIIAFANAAKKEVSKFSNNFEIVLVGNYIKGSNDITKDVVKEMAEQDDTFVALCKPKEGMMGWDMREGLNQAKGNVICVIDGDGQFHIESVSTAYDHLIKGGYDLVKTYRSKRQDGSQRILISKIYNFVFSILFPKVAARDINSKPKMLTREAFSKLNLESDDWFIDAEIMIKLSKHKVKIFEFPIEFFELQGRHSFVKFSAIFEFIKNLIRFRFKQL